MIRMFIAAIPIFLAIGRSQESPHKVVELDCQVCHSPEVWNEIRFDHSNTDFTLTGRHRGLKCQDCHSLVNFRDISKNCISCHTDIHQASLGNWCNQCHTPQSWTIIDAVKAHENTTFPLIGVHARLDCDACHFSEIEGKFSGLKSECYACHREDFQSVGVPNHVASDFSKRCEECHSMFAWSPAEFSRHDALFPIFSGEHAGEWNSCRDCHINPGNYTEFSCLNCHEHNRSRMDDEHREVSGYVYQSNACYNCHPRGTEGESNED